MRKPTGLDIINGLIAGLDEVIAATDAVIAEKGTLLKVSDVLDPRIVEASASFKEAFSLAIVPERKEWLGDVNLRVGEWTNWVQDHVAHIANVEEFRRLYRLDVPKLRNNCVESVARLRRYEPQVRKGAEEARQGMLALLDE